MIYVRAHRGEGSEIVVDDSIAVIGSGPAGLATAKHLLDEGLRPVLFEQSADLGGQWNANSPHSGVWSSMPTNTSHVTTRFSDFSHAADLPMFPSNQQMHAYLRRYASHFKLDSHLRLNTRVDRVAPSGDRWNITFSTQDEQWIDEVFSHVVVASGRYNKPRIPIIKGLDLFEGTNGVTHTFDYAGAEPFAGKRVLVVGNSVSGLEICADLAADARIRVISACRKPRYILNKILAGRPADRQIASHSLVSQVLLFEHYRRLMLPKVSNNLCSDSAETPSNTVG